MLMGMDTVEFWNSYYGYGMNITTELWTVDWWTAVDLDLDRDLIKDVGPVDLPNVYFTICLYVCTVLCLKR